MKEMRLTGKLKKFNLDLSAVEKKVELIESDRLTFFARIENMEAMLIQYKNEVLLTKEQMLAQMEQYSEKQIRDIEDINHKMVNVEERQDRLEAVGNGIKDQFKDFNFKVEVCKREHEEIITKVKAV